MVPPQGNQETDSTTRAFLHLASSSASASPYRQRWQKRSAAAHQAAKRPGRGGGRKASKLLHPFSEGVPSGADAPLPRMCVAAAQTLAERAAPALAPPGRLRPSAKRAGAAGDEAPQRWSRRIMDVAYWSKECARRSTESTQYAEATSRRARRRIEGMRPPSAGERRTITEREQQRRQY